MQYNVIIPVATKDISFVLTTVKYINLNLYGITQIYIITNERNFQKLSNKIPLNCKLINENTMLNGLSYVKIKSYLNTVSPVSVNQTGWYFQQFLKYAFAFSEYCNTDYYLSWDADTLPLHPLSFFKDEHPLFTKKTEFHKAYFNTLNRLLNINKTVDYSFIAEHMLFNRNIVQELIRDINLSNTKGDTWWQKIINACDFENDKYNLFSEFETYGTYCTIKYPDLYQIRQLNTLRGAGLIRGRYINKMIIKRLSMDVDIASFEESHAIFPWNIRFKIRKLLKKIIRNS